MGPIARAVHQLRHAQQLVYDMLERQKERPTVVVEREDLDAIRRYTDEAVHLLEAMMNT